MISLIIYFLINYIYSIFYMIYFFDVENNFVIYFFSLVIAIALLYISNVYYAILKRYFFSVIITLFGKSKIISYNAPYIATGILSYSFYYLLSYLLERNSFSFKYDIDGLSWILPLISAIVIFYYEKNNNI